MPQTVHFVRFEGDRVTQVRIAALGQPIAIHDQNEMRGYLDPEDTHEIAMGDGKPGNGEARLECAADHPETGRGGAGQPEAGAAAGSRIKPRPRSQTSPATQHRPQLHRNVREK